MNVSRLRFPDLVVYQAMLSPGVDHDGHPVLKAPDGLIVVELGQLKHTVMVDGEEVVVSVTPGHHVDTLGDLPLTWQPYVISPAPASPVHWFCGVDE